MPFRPGWPPRGFPPIYPTPLHKLPVYRGGSTQNLPNAEQAAQTVLSLPMHPYLTKGEAQRVVDAVRSALVREDEGEDPHAASN